MKKTLLFVAMIVTVIISSCSKDDSPASQNVNIRYEFSADTLSNYSVGYTADSLGYSEDVNAQSWSKTITIRKGNNAGTDSATITVFPPSSWVGTAAEANATVKIFVNDVEKASNTAVLAGFDRPVGLKASATY